MATLTVEQQWQAASLYTKGKSAREIAAIFGVSIDATYYALRRLGVPRRSASENGRMRFEAKPLSFAIKSVLTPEDESLKLAAVMLYWAEGYKAGGQAVDFANSDPNMALMFVKFLREICGVDELRLRCSLYCYEGQDVGKLTVFWSDLLKIPPNRFVRPYIKRGAPGPRGPRMIHGLVHIRYCDKKLLRQILQWIEDLTNECVGGGVVNRTTL
jgi:hypothetical protein